MTNEYQLKVSTKPVSELRKLEDQKYMESFRLEMRTKHGLTLSMGEFVDINRWCLYCSSRVDKKLHDSIDFVIFGSEDTGDVTQGGSWVYLKQLPESKFFSVTAYMLKTSAIWFFICLMMIIINIFELS